MRSDLAAMADAAEAAGEPSRTWGALLGRADERRQQLDLALERRWRRTARTRAARGGSGDSAQRACDTLDMLKSGTRSAGVAVREK